MSTPIFARQNRRGADSEPPPNFRNYSGEKYYSYFENAFGEQ